MANRSQLKELRTGSEAWNEWRKKHPQIKIDLSGANLNNTDLQGADLSEADLQGVNLNEADLSQAKFGRANLFRAHLHNAVLSGAQLSGASFIEADLSSAILSSAILQGTRLRNATLIAADLRKADLRNANLLGATLSIDTNFCGANLSEAVLKRVEFNGINLRNANLSKTDLSGLKLNDAKLNGANLSGANLSGANLSGANLSGANLTRTLIIETDLTNATLTNCFIYGIAAWNVRLEGAIQKDLIITLPSESTITVDNLKVAQFIYLVLNNAEIRDVIDTIARKAVLILGRFTPERKAVLDALKEALRTHRYLPIMFDFDKPSSQDLTETVTTLAHLSRFIIADLTDPSSIPYELHAVVPNRMVPVLPLLQEVVDPITRKPIHEFPMFRDLRKKYHWVLPIHSYTDLGDLLASLQTKVIEPAEQKVKELLGSEKSIGSSNTHTLSS